MAKKTTRKPARKSPSEAGKRTYYLGVPLVSALRELAVARYDGNESAAAQAVITDGLAQHGFSVPSE